jgi:ComF family protein
LFDTVVRMAVFEDPIRMLVHRLKFYHGWSIGELLAQRAMRLPRVQHVLAHADVLVPVPLHPWRHVTRGFNQADVFATRLARLTGHRVRHPVIRVRHTAAQSLQTSKAARLKNLRNAFALVSPRSIRGQRLVLVDDVMTTGSTLKSFANVLRAASPKSMSVLTIAMGDAKGYAFEAV